MRCALIGLAALALPSCATTAPPAAPSVVTVVCLPMKTYTAEEQSKAADELEKLPADSVLARWMGDYGVLRAANRACRASSP